MAERPEQQGQKGATGREQGPEKGRTQQDRHASRAGVTTMVCLTCGNEKFFEHDVPASMKCDKCGGTVFRAFDTPTEPDEATISRLEETARSIAYDDDSPGTTPDDVRDLDQR